MKRHWYFIYIDECQLCMRTITQRERRYGRRPKAWWKRHEITPFACASHFL